MQAVSDDIAAAGWSLAHVPGDRAAPPWAYTVGLWLSHHRPELTMAGLPDDHMAIILNSVADRITGGEPIDVADDIDGICPCTLTVRKLAADHDVRALRSLLRLCAGRQTRFPSGRVAGPQGKISGRSRVPGSIRGAAADAVAAGRGSSAGPVDQA